MAAWTEAGVEVTYCLCTDGDAGGFDPEVSRDAIGGIRQAEQRAAAREARGARTWSSSATPTAGST